MVPPALTSSDRVLIIGATGFVGKRLIPELVKKNIKLRLLVRDLAKAAPLIIRGADIEVVLGDLVANTGLRAARPSGACCCSSAASPSPRAWCAN
jgi:uncharacterized protein YbjT (DUF2867 family)